VIHVVTLEPFEADEVQAVCKALTAAFGMGSEHVGELEIPEDTQEGDKLDAVKLLAEAGPVKTFADDKILFLLHSPLAARQSPLGAIPTQGYAKYSGDKAVTSDAGQSTDPAARTQALCKLAVHHVGHLWDLHHCLDYRCAMMPPWGVGYARSATAELCSFCREKSERRMKTSAA
jgi:archaemetzincin